MTMQPKIKQVMPKPNKAEIAKLKNQKIRLGQLRLAAHFPKKVTIQPYEKCHRDTRAQRFSHKLFSERVSHNMIEKYFH